MATTPNLTDRIDRLPTARRGDEVLHIITREELASIINDASALMLEEGMRRQRRIHAAQLLRHLGEDS